jgi:dolichol-phosphate mannosyltransferase
MLSFVIPVYNEAPSLDELYAELDGVARQQGYQWELLFVDDGSTDGSWDAIQRLAARDARVRGLRFRRNFGKAAALSAGFREVRGEVVFTLDADLQDDPQEIPRFLEELAAGRDLISGWKQVRHDPWHKVGPSRVFNWLVSHLTGVQLHDHNCGFKCYRRAVLDDLELYGERHRFVPVLAAARGWKVGEVTVHHRARRFGHSKYGVARFVKGFLDLLTVRFLTAYGQRPQHLFGTLGLLALGAGGIGFAVSAVWWLVQLLVGGSSVSVAVLPLGGLLCSLAALLLGALLLAVGLVAELVTAQHMRDRAAYSIHERTPSGPATAGAPAENQAG